MFRNVFWVGATLLYGASLVGLLAYGYGGSQGFPYTFVIGLVGGTLLAIMGNVLGSADESRQPADEPVSRPGHHRHAA